MKNLFKFILVYLIVIIVVVTSYLSISTEKQQQLYSTQSELDGVDYLRDIYHLGISVALHQGNIIFEDDKQIVEKSKKNISY